MAQVLVTWLVCVHELYFRFGFWLFVSVVMLVIYVGFDQFIFNDCDEPKKITNARALFCAKALLVGKIWTKLFNLLLKLREFVSLTMWGIWLIKLFPLYHWKLSHQKKKKIHIRWIGDMCRICELLCCMLCSHDFKHCCGAWRNVWWIHTKKKNTKA